jgi:hypothetical protein
MAVRLSALRTGCALFSRNVIFLLLVLIYVRLSKPQSLLRSEGSGKLKEFIHHKKYYFHLGCLWERIKRTMYVDAWAAPQICTSRQLLHAGAAELKIRRDSFVLYCFCAIFNFQMSSYSQPSPTFPAWLVSVVFVSSSVFRRPLVAKP